MVSIAPVQLPEVYTLIFLATIAIMWTAHETTGKTCATHSRRYRMRLFAIWYG